MRGFDPRRSPHDSRLLDAEQRFLNAAGQVRFLLGRRSEKCCVTRLVSRLACHASEMGSTPVRSAEGARRITVTLCGGAGSNGSKARRANLETVARRPWRPSGLQIRRTGFDSLPSCYGVVVQREDAAFARQRCGFDSRRFHRSPRARGGECSVRPGAAAEHSRGCRPTGGHEAGSLGMRVRFPPAPLNPGEGSRWAVGLGDRCGLVRFQSPGPRGFRWGGAVPCKHRVTGSIPVVSTGVAVPGRNWTSKPFKSAGRAPELSRWLA